MNIYTKTGDSGETGLFGGKRVPKTDPRIEAYGTVDELNAVIGAVIALEPDAASTEALTSIQGQLLVIGSHLATPYNPAEEAPSTLPAFKESWISDMESLVDSMQAELPELTSFILPGGSEAGAQLHVARTVCRRAERCLVALTTVEEIDLGLLRYLNRLSDLLFVMARYVNHAAGSTEQTWNPDN